MSTPLPPSKRRRIDTASDTLKKPFKPPMVNRPQPGAPPAASPATPAPSRKLPTPLPTPTPFRTPSSRPAIQGLNLHPVLGRTPSQPSVPGSTPSRPLPPEDFLEEQKTLLSLLAKRRKESEVLSREISAKTDLVRQVSRIEKSGESERLEELVRKWKGACRIAAEDLFELIKERVEGMGGRDAWRETRKHQGWQGWEGNGNGQGEGEGEGEGEGKGGGNGNGCDGDEREELEGREDDDEEEEEEVEEGKDFTMHMMLMSLNIDPKVVGYDPVEDRWQDWG